MLAPVLGRTAALSAWLSVRFPFVWRTRVPLFVALGLAATALAAVGARTTEISTATVLTLQALLSWLSVWTFLVYGLLLLVLFDLVRRTTPIFAAGHALRMSACAAVSCAALLVPQVVFVRTILPRIAALERESDLKVLIDTHSANGFWQCRTESPDSIEAHRAEIVRDLGRYGLASDLRPARASLFSCLDRRLPRPGAWSLSAWPSDAPPPEGSFYRQGTSISLFQGRIRNVEAAQQYLRHEGPFEPVSHWRRVVGLAALIAVLATLLAGTPLQRARLMANSRRLIAAPAWRWRMPLDERIALRWPVIWSSGVHKTLPLLIFLPVLITWGIDAIVTPILAIAIFAVALLALLRAQEHVRQVPLRLRQEVAVLLIHVTVLVLTSGAAYWFTEGDFVENYSEVLLYGMSLSAIVCGCVEAARNGTTFTAFGALTLTVVLYYVAVTFTSENLSPQRIIADAAILFGLAALLRYRARDAGIAEQRVLIGALLIYSSLWWAGIGISVELPSFFDAAPEAIAIIGAFALWFATIVAILRLTENRRRALAHAGK